MRHYIAAEDVLLGLPSALEDIRAELSVMITSLNAQSKTLLVEGWKGEWADHFSWLSEEMNARQRRLEGAIGGYAGKFSSAGGKGASANGFVKALSDCSDLVQAGQDKVMCSFGGKKVTMTQSAVGYETDTGTPRSRANTLASDLKSSADRLKKLAAKAKNLSVDYGLDAITTTQKAADALSTQMSDFSANYSTAAGEYDKALTAIKTGFNEASSTMNSVVSSYTSGNMVPQGASVSSPVMRAFHMARLLMDLPPQHRTRFEDFCYNANSTYQQLLFSNIASIDIRDWNPDDPKYGIVFNDASPEGEAPVGGVGMDEDGLFVAVDFSRDTLRTYECGGKPVQAPEYFFTLFHEIGHVIDMKTMVEDRAQLDACLADDVRETLARRAETLLDSGAVALPAQDAAGRAALVRQVVDALCAGQVQEGDPGENAPAAQRLSYMLCQQLKSEFRGQGYAFSAWDIRTVSDIYGGMTGGTLRGSYGHPDEYWGDTAPAMPQEDPGKAAFVATPKAELIADTFAAGMTGSDTMLAAGRVWLPSASARLDTLFRQMNAAS